MPSVATRIGFIDAAFDSTSPPVGAADPQCVGKPWLNKERSGSHCGLGFEIALALPLLAALQRRRRPLAPRVHAAGPGAA